MKKVNIMLACLAFVIFACSNEQDSATFEPESPLSDLAVTYHFNGETIIVDFEDNSAGVRVPIASEGLNRMQEITEKYPQLIFSPITDTEMNLYANEDHLYSSLNIRKKESNNEITQGSATESSTSTTFLAAAVQRLTFYYDPYFHSPLNNLTDACFTGGSSSDYWLQRRLQNFNDGVAYTNCAGYTTVYNDIISSMIVAPNSQQYAFRFFVDKNFGASSLWLYGAADETGFNNLANNCYGFLNLRHWNDKISSAKVINLSTGQELNGLVSTGGGGSTGGSTGGGDENGSTDPRDVEIGDVPEIINQ